MGKKIIFLNTFIDILNSNYAKIHLRHVLTGKFFFVLLGLKNENYILKLFFNISCQVSSKRFNRIQHSNAR